MVMTTMGYVATSDAITKSATTAIRLLILRFSQKKVCAILA